MSTALPGLDAGDLQVYDRYVPQLKGGAYEITVTQQLDGVATGTLSSKQRFTVSAPQVAVDPGELVQLYPPNGATGQFADVLPFVVLSDPTLPWERAMTDADMPWMALLVLTEEEVAGAATVTVGEFLGLSGVLVPQLDLEADVGLDQACNYVRLETSLFHAIAPRADELAYLAHVRRANASDRAASLAAAELLWSVVVANRFPAAGETAVKNVVHLVSLEGLAPYLVDDPRFTRSGKDDGPPTFDEIALLSLASWTFQALPDPAGTFEGLAMDLLYSEYDRASKTMASDELWLRLPQPSLDTSDPNAAEVADRIADGYVPLAYHTRTGEETFAWYRGPLAPLLSDRIEGKEAPFLTADAALVYDPVHGVFDCSLAAAWQIGRATALADQAFGRLLLDLRRKLHLLTDRLHDRLVRDHFDTPEDVAALAADGQLVRSMVDLLDADLLRDLGKGPGPGPVVPPAAPEPPDSDARTAMGNFLSEEATQQALLDLVGADLDPVAQWLARLSLLYPVPFTYLVPDPSMLPLGSLAVGIGTPVQGSIRFFYVDPNWIAALLDGATSIGLESSLHTFLNEIAGDLLRDAAAEAAREIRTAVTGVASPSGEGGGDATCGFLLRSPLVSGWPNLAVRPVDDEGNALRMLRMDRLAPGVLLCLFDGVPSQVAVGEPQEGVRFGIDPEGMAELRNLIPPASSGDPPVGHPLGHTVPVRDPSAAQQFLMRAPGSRVVDIAPGSPTGLVQTLVAALAGLGQPVALETFGAAALALQLIDAPQQLTFACGAPR